MAIWAHVELSVFLDSFQAVVLDESGWYRLRVRAYKPLGNKVTPFLYRMIPEQLIAAFPVNAADGNATQEGRRALPKELVPIIKASADNDTYMSKPFYSENLNYNVRISELARFIVELPALPSIISSSAVLVEVEVLLYHEKRKEDEYDDDGPAYSVEVVDTKVLRVSHLGLHHGQHYACNLEGDHINSLLHMRLHKNVIKFCLGQSINQPLSRQPCGAYRKWRSNLKYSRNKEASHWFCKSNALECAFYRNDEDEKLTEALLRTLVRCVEIDDDPKEPKKEEPIAESMLSVFVSQIMRGQHACERPRGFGKHQSPVETLPISQVETDMNEGTYRACCRLLLYYYATIVAWNAASLGAAMNLSDDSLTKEGAEEGNETTEEYPDSMKEAHKFWKALHTETVDPTTQPQLIFNKGAVVTLVDGKFQRIGDTYNEEVEPLFSHWSAELTQVMLCKRLNSIAESMGIKRFSKDKIAVKLPTGIKIILQDVVIPAWDSANYIDDSLSQALNKFLFGISSWVYLKYEEYITNLYEEAEDKEWTTRYCESQGSFFKMLGDPAMTKTQLMDTVKSLTITDEHHFFLLDCFPFYSYAPDTQTQGDIKKKETGTPKRHLIVLLHGYQGYPVTMRFFKNTIMGFIRKVNIMVACSYFDDPEASIDNKAKRLSEEIKMHIRRNLGGQIPDKLSVIAHSMGGLVIRAALKYIPDLQPKLHALVSLLVPHIGLPFMHSPVLNRGCKLFASMKDSTCLKEVMLSDHGNRQECYLYDLSEDSSISGFKLVKLVGILQDKIAHAYSCLLDLSLVRRKNQTINMMVDNIQSSWRSVNLDRCYVNYSGAAKYVRWTPFDSHLHLVDTALLARIFIFMFHDIF